MATVRLNKGIVPYLTPNTLNVITIDNVDILQPYAIVSAVKSRSWHGTSVQCIQPRPITVTLNKQDQLSLPESVLTETSSQSAKRDISSPAMSPITKQLNKRR
jgi:hypothetical protein